MGGGMIEHTTNSCKTGNSTNWKFNSGAITNQEFSKAKLSGIQACHYGIPLGSPCPALLTLPVEAMGVPLGLPMGLPLLLVTCIPTWHIPETVVVILQK